MYCFICNKDCPSILSLSKHLAMAHKMSKDEVFALYLERVPDIMMDCVVCSAKLPKLKTSGGSKTCSPSCSETARKNINLGRKQSKETVQKRVSSTDQKKKESNRQKTMYEKYGRLYDYPEPEERSKKISDSLSGKGKAPEHLAKIAKNRKLNGTNTHREETKRQISEGVRKFYRDNPEAHKLCTPKSQGRNHTTGYESGIYYRSSYERDFIRYCISNSIQIESAESSTHRVRYTFDGKERWYYPDFYLRELDLYIEVKPSAFIDEPINKEKIKSVLLLGKSIVSLTELEIYDETRLKEIL